MCDIVQSKVRVREPQPLGIDDQITGSFVCAQAGVSRQPAVAENPYQNHETVRYRQHRRCPFRLLLKLLVLRPPALVAIARDMAQS
jgi:hypothetical protein